MKIATFEGLVKSKIHYIRVRLSCLEVKKSNKNLLRYVQSDSILLLKIRSQFNQSWRVFKE